MSVNLASNHDIQIYWEKQESSFCGVHTVNNLLQSPYYDEVDFSELAGQLDIGTRTLLQQSNDDMGDNNNIEYKSDNVDESGNFSVEVLIHALQIFNVELINLHHTAAIQYQLHPELADAYILHMYNHWIAVRKINHHWYNLNSVLPYGPELITVTYLSEFIAQLQSQGFTALVVIGHVPYTQPDHNQQRGEYYTHQQCVDNMKKPRPQRNTSQLQRLSPDHELRRAIAESMGKSIDMNDSDNDEDDAQLQAILQQSMQSSNMDDDAQLQAAIRASMQ